MIIQNLIFGSNSTLRTPFWTGVLHNILSGPVVFVSLWPLNWGSTWYDLFVVSKLPKTTQFLVRGEYPNLCQKVGLLVITPTASAKVRSLFRVFHSAIPFPSFYWNLIQGWCHSLSQDGALGSVAWSVDTGTVSCGESHVRPLLNTFNR